MIRIPEEIREFLRTHLAYVATVDGKGMPNVVPKGDVAVCGENEIVFADLYSHQTKKNLKSNPHVSICVVNPAAYTGYQLKGRARIVERGKAYDRLLREAGSGGQLKNTRAKYAVRIRVNKIIDIGYGLTADKEIGLK